MHLEWSNFTKEMRLGNKYSCTLQSQFGFQAPENPDIQKTNFNMFDIQMDGYICILVQYSKHSTKELFEYNIKDPGFGSSLYNDCKMIKYWIFCQLFGHHSKIGPFVSWTSYQ